MIVFDPAGPVNRRCLAQELNNLLSDEERWLFNVSMGQLDSRTSPEISGAAIQEVGHDSGKTDDGDYVLDCPVDPVCGPAARNRHYLNRKLQLPEIDVLRSTTFFLSGMTSATRTAAVKWSSASVAGGDRKCLLGLGGGFRSLAFFLLSGVPYVGLSRMSSSAFRPCRHAFSVREDSTRHRNDR